MRTRTAFKILICASALLLSAAVSAAEWTGTIVTANERDNSLSFIDWPGRQEVKVAVPIAPHNVQVSADGKLILAVGAGIGGDGHAAHGTTGHLVFVDPTQAKPTIVGTIVLPGHPAHVVTDLQSRFAFVTDADANAVVVIDLSTKTIAGTIAVGKYPHGLRTSPDGREIYVANMRDASVSVVDVAARKQVARINVGRGPVQVGFTPDGKLAVVSLNSENAVAIIDTVQRAVTSKRPVGRGPVQVFSSADGKIIYVANQGSEKRPDSRLALVPLSGTAKTSFIEAGAGAHGVSVSDDGSLITVTNTYAGTVSVVDAVTAKVLATMPVGRGPNGVTMLRAMALTR